jgi:hypothetical protein
MATNVKTLIFMIGLDKNSIVVPISSYVLGENSPLSSIGQMRLTNGAYDSINQFNASDVKKGLYFGDTHFRPNSAYRLRNRVPFTFFAPLQSEMGDAYASGDNTGGEYGMGYRYNSSFPGDNIYGVWDKIVFNNYRYDCTDNNQIIAANSLAALSSWGNTKALFVLGNNANGQLGTSSAKQYYATWTRVPGQWQDVCFGEKHMLAINSSGHLYACGDNTSGQLGIGSGTSSTNTLTLVDNTRSYVQLASYGSCSMVIDSNGFLWSCGRNNVGQLGIGNTTSPIYTLTREALNYSWSSVKASQEIGYFVAISNKSLYGVGVSASNRYYFGVSTNAPAVPYAFTREDLNLTDVQTVDVSRYGTFIRRENQDMIFAAGYRNFFVLNNIATLTGTDSPYYVNYFIKTFIPSNASKFVPSFTTLFYIQNNILYRKLSYTKFTTTSANAFDLFSGSNTSLMFMLSARNDIRPTPTPTKTPAPTPTPSAVPYSDSGVEGFGFFHNGLANNTTVLDPQAFMYYTTATNYGFNLNPGGNLASVSINQSQALLPQCTGTFGYYPNGGAFLINNRRPEAQRRFYNNRDFAKCVFGWGKNNRFYAIAYTTNSVYNSQSNFYLFKPHISYPANAGGFNSTVNRPVVACLPVAGSNNDGVEIPVPNRGWIEELVGERGYGSRRAQIDFQFSPYTEKCGILYWRTDRKYPSTSTSQEFIDLIYAESSTNNDLNTWTTGKTIDTDLYKLQNQTRVFFNTYNMIKPKLYYDKTDSPTALYLKGSGTSTEILIYKNIITNETTSIASGNFYPSQAMLNINQPDYQLIFNNNNKPVIFFNAWPDSYVAGDSDSGTNTLRCYFNGTTSNVMPLSVVRNTDESGESTPGKALIGNTFYDLYHESSTDTIYIAYMDNWIPGNLKSMPRTIRVINYNYLTNTIITTETIYTIPANYLQAPSYAQNIYCVTGLKIFFDKRLQKIIVTHSIFKGSPIGPTTVAHAFYQRNGPNTWANISPNNNTVILDRGGFILKR